MESNLLFSNEVEVLNTHNKDEVIASIRLDVTLNMDQDKRKKYQIKAPVSTSTPIIENKTKNTFAVIPKKEILIKLIYQDKRGQVYETTFLFDENQEISTFKSNKMPNIIIDAKKVENFSDPSQLKIKLFKEKSDKTKISKQDLGTIHLNFKSGTRQKTAEWYDKGHEAHIKIERD